MIFTRRGLKARLKVPAASAFNFEHVRMGWSGVALRSSRTVGVDRRGLVDQLPGVVPRPPVMIAHLIERRLTPFSGAVHFQCAADSVQRISHDARVQPVTFRPSSGGKTPGRPLPVA